jgi:hypothetical protein
MWNKGEGELEAVLFADSHGRFILQCGDDQVAMRATHGLWASPSCLS